jgi:hypothetical protein
MQSSTRAIHPQEYEYIEGGDFRVPLTGALGFEPRDGGTKTRCLTTWLRPKNFTVLNIAVSPGLMSSTLIVDFR